MTTHKHDKQAQAILAQLSRHSALDTSLLPGLWRLPSTGICNWPRVLIDLLTCCAPPVDQVTSYQSDPPRVHCTGVSASKSGLA
jgi:hypothetical protein